MAGEIFELTKKYFERLTKTTEGQEALAKYDQSLGFEVVADGEGAEWSKKYYVSNYTPKVKPLEIFVVQVKNGKVSFKEGGDVPVPPSNWEELDNNMRVLAEKHTFPDLYNGKIRASDAIIPESEQPTLLNIYPYQCKRNMASWVCSLIKLIAKQNKEERERKIEAVSL